MSNEIETLRSEMDQLKPSVDKYFDLARKLDRLVEEKQENEKWTAYRRFSMICDYIPPTLPSVGVEAESGSASFVSKEDGEGLVEALRKVTSWNKSYVLEWSGPGQYVADVTYKYDMDGDLFYTVIFRKNV